jgi:hypothetical protein
MGRRLRVPLVVGTVLFTAAAVFVAIVVAIAGSPQTDRTIVVIGDLRPTGQMAAGRYEAFATLLDDGTVLVTGSTGLGEVVEAELYDPGTGSFEPTGSMGIGPARGRVRVQVLLDDGRVLVAGSTGGQRDGIWPFTPFARVYDPAARAFLETSPPPDGAFATDLVVDRRSGGRIAIFSGIGDPTGILFDPSTRAFATIDESTAIPPNASDLVTIGMVDGRVLTVADIDGRRPSAWLSDPPSGTIESLPEPPIITGGPRSALLLADGRVLIGGGSPVTFDPATRRFEAVDGPASMPLANLRDGRVLLEVPMDVPIGASDRSELWTFDPVTGRVGPLSRVELPEGCCASWTVLRDGAVLAIGGFDGDTPSAAGWVLR